jgi:hypothetical protein
MCLSPLFAQVTALTRRLVRRSGGADGFGVAGCGEQFLRAGLAGSPDEPAGKLRDCKRALRRAGFHVEYATQSTGGCLLARRGTRGR